MVATVGRGVWVVVGVAVVSSLFTRPAPAPTRPLRPSTYPIAADAEAERTELSPNFSVTWIDDASSPDAPSLRDRDHDGVPDSMASLLNAFETARTFMLGELGYRPPPGPGPIRIYVSSAHEDLAFTKLAPGGEGLSRPSFIVFPADMLRPPLSARSLRAVAVHEYFHAIQNGYDSQYDHWFGEASATWVQDVFDDAFDSNHHYLRDFVASPRTSLVSGGGDYPYGAFLFVEFLVERYANGNPDLVREIWEGMAAHEGSEVGTGAIEAIAAVLERRGVPFGKAWAEFLLWRWDLDRFEEGAAYQGAVGRKWPKPLRTTQVLSESCRLSTAEGVGLPPLSGDYAVFRPGDRPDKAGGTVAVEGPVGSSAFVLTQGDGGTEKVQLLPIDEAGLATAHVRFGDEQVRRIVLGVGNAEPGSVPAVIDYSLRIAGRSATEVAPTSPPAEAHLFGGLTLSGRVLCDGQPETGADVVLVQDKRSGEQRTFPMTTIAGGLWSRTFDPEQTSTYHVGVVDPLLTPATSRSWDVAIRVALQLEVIDDQVVVGEPVTFEGEIGPPHPGALVLVEYRRPDLSWRAGPQLAARQDGTFEGTLSLPAPGIWQLRATVLSTGDEDHIGDSTINDVSVNVT